LPCSSTAWTAKTFLARSMPTWTMAMDFPFRVSEFDESRIPIVALVAGRCIAAGSGRGSPFHSLGLS
jgi:hypothetical protein